MDVFRMKNPTTDTTASQGRIINSLKDKLWIERYRDPGEFKFVADVDSGAKEALPLGSLISHVGTKEIMIVENHEIVEEEHEIPEVVITGRSFETIFEQRAVGMNVELSGGLFVTQVQDYTLLASETWWQAVTLAADHVVLDNQETPANALPFVTVTSVVPEVGTAEDRIIARGDLYTRFIELLTVDNLGVYNMRPGVWSPLAEVIGQEENLLVVVHSGTDRSDEITFSYESGDIKRADYFWSNKKTKTHAYVYGKWIHMFVQSAPQYFNRRVISVDASDIDQQYSSLPPVGADRTRIISAMRERGLQAIAAHNDTILSKAEVNDNRFDAQYRVDYDVGDIVSVVGNYNTETKMRITEYVEIEDQNGSSGHPTLALP